MIFVPRISKNMNNLGVLSKSGKITKTEVHLLSPSYNKKTLTSNIFVCGFSKKFWILFLIIELKNVSKNVFFIYLI